MRDVYRMTPRQFRAACDAGAFGDEKVELLAGIPFVMTKNPPHEIVVFGLAEVLRPIFAPAGLLVFEEKAVRMGRWRPIPDIAIVQGPRANYQAKLPGPADITLLVEVADRTYRRDRGRKYRRYAACGIPHYWIVKLSDRLVEVHADPVGRGKAARYRSCLTYAEGDRVPILNSSFLVGDILPH
jgi:Uma2 family endonuclease